MMRARLDAERRMRDAGITPEVLKVIDEVNELERRTGLSAEDMQVLAILGPHYTEARHSPTATVTRGKREAPAAGTNPQNSAQAAPVARKPPESNVAPPTAPRAAPAPPIPAVAANRRTWWHVAGPYMVEILRAGQYATAKELNAALTARAGNPDSPFDKGEGQNRGSLFVREIGKPLAVKTIQNRWQELRAEAKK